MDGAASGTAINPEAVLSQGNRVKE